MQTDLFELTKGSWDELTVYKFGKKIITHQFCPTCGVMLTGSISNMLVLNARTIDGIDVDKLDIQKYNGAMLL